MRNSLSLRLAVTSLLGIAGALLVAGWLLVALFEGHIERRFNQSLHGHFEELVAAAEVTKDGAVRLTWRPADPRFNLPYSGWYWEILSGGRVVARSASLVSGDLPLGLGGGPGKGPSGGPARPDLRPVQGPEGVPLRALVKTVRFPEAKSPVVFVVAGPLSDIRSDVRRFAGDAGLTLAALGIGLLGVVLAQIRFGLRPLRRMGRALADIRAGRRARLPDDFPDEVRAVVQELNALLDYNAALLTRARARLGDLAHSLKNPLTVLHGEAGDLTGHKGKIMRAQIALVMDTIERQLTRARVAGADNILGARAAVAPIVEDLRYSLGLLHKGRNLAIRSEGLDGLVFRGDAQDLEEMLGNLMDNACKWARSEIIVCGRAEDGRLRITVADDGPGIPESQMPRALGRGQRLDESVPGSGLGLGIVADIAALYHGALDLGRSQRGGLAARLDLPAAPTG